MRKRTLAGAGTAAVIVAAGTALAPLMASAQTAGPAVHTLKFDSDSIKGGEVDTKTSTVFADKDVNAKGKVIGFDTISGTFNPKTNKVSGYFSVALTNGVIYATVSGNPATGVYTGKVIGGGGAYKGAKGTVAAKDLNPQGTKTAVTIKYAG